jgi:hypothetical protein
MLVVVKKSSSRAFALMMVVELVSRTVLDEKSGFDR